MEKTCSASTSSPTPAQIRSPDARPTQVFSPSKLPPMKFSHLCGSSAQHGACVEGTHHGSPLFSPQGPSAKGPEEICISGRGGEKAAGSNFCKCVGRGDAVRWPRKGWRAATRSSSGQTVQEEKWLRKSFLGSLRERLRRAKPSRDVRPQPYVQTLSKSTPNPPPRA